MKLPLKAGRVLLRLSRSGAVSSGTSLKAPFDKEAAAASVCVISSWQRVFAFIRVNVPQNLPGFWRAWKCSQAGF